MANASSPCVQFEDNNVHSLNGWLPCGPWQKGGPVISCCKTHSDCLDFGICHSNHSLTGASGYYQGSCTDPNYNDRLCPHLCNDQPFPDVIFNASLREWQCCGANSQGKVSCEAPATNEFFNAPAPSLLSTTASAGQTTPAKGTETRTGTGATGTTSPKVPSATNSPAPSSSSLSTGAIAGIAVGAVVVGLIIIGLLVWYLLRRRKSKKAAALQAQTDGQSGHHAQSSQQELRPLRNDFKYGNPYPPVTAPPPLEADSISRFELAQPGVESYVDNMKGPKMNQLSNERPPQELPANLLPQELPAHLLPQELPANRPGHMSPRP